MSQSRKAFLECEANQKLHQAIRWKVRPGNKLIFQPGDHVFYKRNNEGWNSPGIVIARENKQILVKHGGQYITVHPCWLQFKSKNDQLNTLSFPACKLDRTQCSRTRK